MADPDVAAALGRLEQATQFLLAANDQQGAAAVSVPYLRAFGLIAGGVMMARSVAALEGMEAKFAEAKRGTAKFYMSHVLPQYIGCLEAVHRGGMPVKDFPSAMFAA
jgi:hypothetical protein